MYSFTGGRAYSKTIYAYAVFALHYVDQQLQDSVVKECNLNYIFTLCTFSQYLYPFDISWFDLTHAIYRKENSCTITYSNRLHYTCSDDMQQLLHSGSQPESLLPC